MNEIRRWWDRMRGSMSASDLDNEMREEMQNHIELMAAEHMKAGFSEEEARRRARRQFGPVDVIMEESRDVQRTRWLEDIWSDLRYALRSMRLQSGWAFGIIAVLALGIGANAAIFELAGDVLFREPDGVRPEELVRIFGQLEGESDLTGTAYPMYRDYERLELPAIAGVAAFSGVRAANLSASGEAPRRVRIMLVSENYFPLLGITPGRGRLIANAEESPAGSAAIAVLSDELWRSQFAGDPGIVGRTIRINNQPLTIVGVAPRDFAGVTVDERADVWVPLAMTNEVAPGLAELRPLERYGFTWLQVVARLQPGATAAQAEQAARAAVLNLPPPANGNPVRPIPVVQRASEVTIAPDAGETAQRLSQLLIGLVVLVLLLACADASTLVLARAERRKKEIGIRLAIGATRARIVRQLTVETLVLCSFAGALGAALAFGLISVIPRSLPADFILPVPASARLDPVVILVTSAFATACLLLFGLLRSVDLRRVAALLRSAPPARAGRIKVSLSDVLVAFQLALCVVFIIGTTLLARTLANAARLDLGFEPNGVVTATFDLANQGYDRDRSAVFQQQLLERLRASPVVSSAALSIHVPMQGGGVQTSVGFEGHTYAADGGDAPVIDVNIVSPGYADVLGIPIVQGRDFGPADARGAPRVALITKTTAETYWPGQSALGKTLDYISSPPSMVVGILDDSKWNSIRETTVPVVMIPAQQMGWNPMNVMIKTRLSDADAIALLRATVAEIDPAVPLFGVGSMQSKLAEALARERLLGLLLASFAILAFVLSTSGLYALVSYNVRSRIREWGIRMAIGARPIDLLTLVHIQTMRIAAVGILGGVLVAFAGSRLLEGFLFGVAARDLASYAAAVLLLGLAAAVAGYRPARLATRTDPVGALKSD